jgi:signal transduction histidine kinase
VVFYGADGWAVDANLAAEHRLGLSREQILSRNVPKQDWELLREDGTVLPAHQHPALVTLGTGQPIREQIIGVRSRRAPIRWLRMNTQPVQENGSNGGIAVVATFCDITDLRNSRERIRELAQRLECVREDERRSIARILHEGIAQDLAVLFFRLARFESPSTDQQQVASLCTEFRRALRTCMDNLRRGANDMRPPAFSYLTLGDALRDHAQNFGGATGLHIGVQESESFPPLPETTRMLFYRAGQELLTNVARHAKATNVEIQLHVSEQQVFMEICDDGVGVAEEAVNKAGSFGLLGIRERFEALGGQLKVSPNLPAGTRMRVCLPSTHIALDPSSG